MEHVGAISEGEWNSLNGICSEDAEFMTQLLGNISLPNEVPSDTNFPVSCWPADDSNGNIAGVDESAMYSSDGTIGSMYSFSQGSSYSVGSSVIFPFTGHESYYPSVCHQVVVTNYNLMAMDYCMMEDKNNSLQVHMLGIDVMGGDDFLNQDVRNNSIESNNNMSEDVLQGKNVELGTVLALPMPGVPREERVCSLSESKKRSRVHGKVQRNKRSINFNKYPNVDDSDEDNSNKSAVVHRQNANSCCWEDDSNASHEVNGVMSSSSSKGSHALNSNGKTRANRGSAIDPQSLYARHSSGRENEDEIHCPCYDRLTISTMLEEAVQYVKFSQLQIKLLSSDDLWIYAPIAHNGMNIGLDIKISTPKPQS